KNTSAVPTAINAVPSTFPHRLATRSACPRSFVRAHTRARTSRPPSNGVPGNRATPANTKLAVPSQSSDTSGTEGSSGSTSNADAQQIRPRTTLVAGPDTAIMASARGFAGAAVCSAAPPNSHRTTRRVGTPWRRATNAWASSCTTTEARKASATASPPNQYRTEGSSGAVTGSSFSARIVVKTATPTTAESRSSRRMSPIRPSKKEERHISTARVDQLGEVEQAIRVAPLVVVPTEHLHEVGARGGEFRVEHARRGGTHDVPRHEWSVDVPQVGVQPPVGGLAERTVHLTRRHGTSHRDGQIDQRTVLHRDAHGHGLRRARQFGQQRTNRTGQTRGRRHDVHRRGSRPA